MLKQFSNNVFLTMQIIPRTGSYITSYSVAVSMKAVLLFSLVLLLASCSKSSNDDGKERTVVSHTAPWQEVVDTARGQSVYWNAWAGDEKINAYIQWVAEQVNQQYGITLKHVKLQDTAEAVSRILAEKSAGRIQGGSVDLMWINGENFASLKENNMLFGPFVEQLPSSKFIDFANNPSLTTDFTIPVEGLEAPWGRSLFVFIYDSQRIAKPPRTYPALLAWAQQNPARFTYPAPPNFTGSSFLKQAMLSLAPKDIQFSETPDDATFQRATAPLFSYLDKLHPHLWRKGKTFPRTGPAQRQLLADGELDITLSFNPSDALSAIASGLLPDTVKSYGLDSGSLGNTHFLAIAANASASEGARVVINFLLSPAAQARKADIHVWGDAAVLSLERLAPAEQKLFRDKAVAGTLATVELKISDGSDSYVYQEPHPSWLRQLENQWAKRYAQ